MTAVRIAGLTKRHGARAAQVLGDLEGLLSVRGAQARCLACPVTRSAPPVASSASRAPSPLAALARLLFD